MHGTGGDRFMASVDPHAERVLAVLGGRGLVASPAGSLAPSVLASWRRCVDRHGLEPHRQRSLEVVTAVELREVLSPIEELVEIATPDIDRLFARVASVGAIVTLNDGAGRTLLLRCTSAMAREVGAAGLHLGSIWSESSQGTNGIGVCLEEQSPISVVATDHFCSHLINLSCTVAPIFYDEGQLAAVLNITTSRPGAAEQHALLREMVTAVTTRIENLWFERRHGSAECILRLSRFRDFNDLSSEARVALDPSGRIVAATANARATLTMEEESLLGRTSNRLFGISDSLLREQGPKASVCRARTG